MNQLKSKYIQEIDTLIKTKISEINMSLYVHLVKEDSYKEFVTNLHRFLCSEIKKVVNLNFKKINIDIISDRFDVLLTNYLKIIDKNSRKFYEKNACERNKR